MEKSYIYLKSEELSILMNHPLLKGQCIEFMIPDNSYEPWVRMYFVSIATALWVAVKDEVLKPEIIKNV